MSKSILIQAYRTAFGIIIFGAVFWQLYSMRDSGDFNLINYVSYFTVLSNIFVASVLIFTGVRSETDSIHFDFARGAATLYILVTGLGFIFLLGGDNRQLLPWVNIIVHYMAPIVMLVDWVIGPLYKKIDFNKALAWIAPPLAYLLFCFIRGKIVNWYPYSFLDLKMTSMSQMLTDLFAVSFGMILLTYFLTLKR